MSPGIKTIYFECITRILFNFFILSWASPFELGTIKNIVPNPPQTGVVVHEDWGGELDHHHLLLPPLLLQLQLLLLLPILLLLLLLPITI